MLRAASFLLLTVYPQLLALDVKITPAEREEDIRWLGTLGVRAPQNWLLDDPYAKPWTRRSLVVPATWFRQKNPEKVRADLFRADLQVLRGVMENVYGGWISAERRGW